MNLAPQPRVYPAVYSGVGVYECMIRGIAVMRRRQDSFVNATQILKVAGIDKGRRTKILEKEILPGKHEIVQGGYGKYQGTWIPLERGRDVATQYGVAPLLAPLFDHVPNAGLLGGIPGQLGPPLRGPAPVGHVPFPMRGPPYMIHYMPPNMMPGRPPMFPPGAQMYHQYPQMPPGAQGRLPPGMPHNMPPMYAHQPLPHHMQAQSMMNPHLMGPAGRPPGPPAPTPLAKAQQPTLKRSREELEVDHASSQDNDTPMLNTDENPSHSYLNGGPPSKKARTDSGPSNGVMSQPSPFTPNGRPHSPILTIDPKALLATFPQTTILPESLEPNDDELIPRAYTQPTIGRVEAKDAISKSNKRTALYRAIQEDESNPALRLLLKTSDDSLLCSGDINVVIDDKGHTALHVAAALGKMHLIDALVSRGADVHRGNFSGETPLMRAILANHHYDSQTFKALLKFLRQSIRTRDSSQKTILHHIAYVASVPGHSAPANYYLETVLLWIGDYQSSNYGNLVDLQDENGDTALNVAARVGVKSLVATLSAVGAKLNIENKYGLKAADFGIVAKPSEPQETKTDAMQIDIPTPTRGIDNVVGEMIGMITSLAYDMTSERQEQEKQYKKAYNRLQKTTKTLAASRQELQEWNNRCEELAQVDQRIINLHKSLEAEDIFDWTGRVAIERFQKDGDISPAFLSRNVDKHPPTNDVMELELQMDSERSLNLPNTAESVVLLRRMKLWHERMYSLLDKQLSEAKGATAEKELQLRKVVALCTGIPEETVDQRLESLLLAVESEGQNVDIGRLANFMQKVGNVTS